MIISSLCQAPIGAAKYIGGDLLVSIQNASPPPVACKNNDTRCILAVWCVAISLGKPLDVVERQIPFTYNTLDSVRCGNQIQIIPWKRHAQQLNRLRYGLGRGTSASLAFSEELFYSCVHWASFRSDLCIYRQNVPYALELLLRRSVAPSLRRFHPQLLAERYQRSAKRKTTVQIHKSTTAEPRT